MRKALAGALLVVLVAILVSWILLRGSKSGIETGVAQDAPKAEDSGEKTDGEAEPDPEPELPYGQYSIPFERGAGYAKFVRQNDMLRVDVDVRLPYSAGDGQRSRGSCVDLILSVDGLHGRHLFFYPNPIWLPDGQGSFPPYRIEMSYDKNKDEPLRLQGEPSFVGTSDIKFWDHWTASIWIDLRYVLIPGNSPTSLAETWHAGLVMGNEAATLVYPSGLDVQNPGKTPKSLLSFDFAKLPEVDDDDENPRDELIKAERERYDAMRGIEAKFAVKDYAGVMESLAARIESHPTEVWPHYLSYLLSLTARQRGLPGVDTDYVKYETAYIDACPGQSSAHLDYLSNLLGDGEFDKATEYAKLVFASELCANRPATDGYMRRAYHI